METTLNDKDYMTIDEALAAARKSGKRYAAFATWGQSVVCVLAYHDSFADLAAACKGIAETLRKFDGDKAAECIDIYDLKAEPYFGLMPYVCTFYCKYLNQE